MNLTDADRAYLQIKEKIITVEMPPGSVIREAELMQELSLGRTPIREALKQLRAENLVVVAPRRGMFVADVAITDLQQIYEVRIELEALCARLAAERITPEQLAEMKSLVTEYQREDRSHRDALPAPAGAAQVARVPRPLDWPSGQAERDEGQAGRADLSRGDADLCDKRQLMALDRRFHHLLAQATGNRFLRNEFELFYNHSLRIWYLALNQIQPDDLGLDAHIEILDAIEAQDSDQAEQRMREHIQHFHNTIKLHL